jgi:hypothetical protein
MSRFADPEHASVHKRIARARPHPRRHGVDEPQRRAHRKARRAATRPARARVSALRAEPARLAGYAFAFDLPTSQLLDAFINQRFWRGAIVFAAGPRARRAIGSAIRSSPREIDLLFESIRRSLSWLDAHPERKPPSGRPARSAGLRQPPSRCAIASCRTPR